MPSGPRPDPPDGTARVALSGTIFATGWANVFWVDLTTSASPSDADLLAVLGDITSAWNTNVRPQLNTATYLKTGKLTYFESSGVERQVVNAVSYEGGISSQQHNCAASIVVDWFISAHYRGGHPRSYWPGPDDSSIDNGSTLHSSYRANLATAAAGFLTAVNAISSGAVTGVEMGTVSFQHANAWRSPPLFRPYIGSGIRQVLGTQKRRLTSPPE